MPRKPKLTAVSSKKSLLNDKHNNNKIAQKGPGAKRKNSKPSLSNTVTNSESSEESDSNVAVAAPRTVKNVKFFAEQCILSNSKARPKTSDRTLSSLRDKLDLATLQMLVKTKPDPHAKEQALIDKGFEANMDKWLMLMQEGFNIMLYGVGSKLHFLDCFVNDKLKERDTVVIHGFFPTLNVKQILSSIVEEFLGHQGAFSNLQSQVDFIIENLDTDLYLIVHNMDSPTLYAERTLSLLCQLAKCDKIHFIASVDHVNSGLIWNSSCAACFKFLWFDMTSFKSYHTENAYESSFLVQQNNALTLSSLTHVFCSLTPNAQGIFLLLAKAQLEQEESQRNGLQFKELFRLCREAFLVNSDYTLETQLTEFKDHNMVRLKRGQDGLEYLYIPINNRTLKEFIDIQE